MPRTSSEKLWLGGAAAVAVLIAVVGYFFLISPQRAKTSSVQAQVTNAQLQTSTLQSRIVSLTAQQKKLATFRTALVRARAALPTLGDLSASPMLLKSLQRIAQQTGTSVSSLTLGNPVAVVPPAAPIATSTSSPSASATPSATSTPVTSLYSVAITTAVSGSIKSLTGFLTDLQSHQPRAVLITGVTITGVASGARTVKTMNLTMTAFVRPSTAPAASGTPTTSASTP